MVMPFHNLSLIKGLMRERQYRITGSAQQGALSMGFDEENIYECILDFLNETHFYKAMPSETFPELWQDVYKINYRGYRIYLKLQIGHTGRSVVISFKEDTS